MGTYRQMAKRQKIKKLPTVTQIRMLLTLSPDLLQLIFAFFDGRTTIRCGCTCKQLRTQIVYVNMAFKPLLYTRWDMEMWCHFMLAGYKLTHVHVNFVFGTLLNIVGERVPKLPGCVHTLNLSYGDRLTDVSALAECSELHTLDLSRCSKLRDVSALAGCGSLHTLDLSNCKQLGDVSALTGCRSLHTLNFSYCYKLKDVSAPTGCRSLRTLDLSYGIKLTDVSGLAGCGSLHTLDLSDCYKLRDVSALAGCGSLHTLELRRCYQLTDVSALAKLSFIVFV